LPREGKKGKSCSVPVNQKESDSVESPMGKRGLIGGKERHNVKTDYGGEEGQKEIKGSREGR